MPPKPFKPPRPSIGSFSAKKVTKDKSAPRKSTGTSKSKPSAAAKPKPRASGSLTSFTRPSINLSLSSDSEADSLASPSRSSTASSIPARLPSVETEEEEERETIPPQLLTRLLHEFFKDEGTRLSAQANKAVGQYMDVFVREAFARAAHTRAEEDATNGRGGLGDGFLEVEDLEKLAPQLLMDF